VEGGCGAHFEGIERMGREGRVEGEVFLLLLLLLHGGRWWRS